MKTHLEDNIVGKRFILIARALYHGMGDLDIYREAKKNRRFNSFVMYAVTTYKIPANDVLPVAKEINRFFGAGPASARFFKDLLEAPTFADAAALLADCEIPELPDEEEKYIYEIIKEYDDYADTLTKEKQT